MVPGLCPSFLPYLRCFFVFIFYFSAFFLILHACLTLPEVASTPSPFRSLVLQPRSRFFSRLDLKCLDGQPRCASHRIASPHFYPTPSLPTAWLTLYLPTYLYSQPLLAPSTPLSATSCLPRAHCPRNRRGCLRRPDGIVAYSARPVPPSVSLLLTQPPRSSIPSRPSRRQAHRGIG